MVISPAIRSPNTGDAISAKWAADVTAAVNSAANPADANGTVASPFGRAAPQTSTPQLDGPPLQNILFKVMIRRDAGDTEDSIWCNIPDPAVGAVFVDGNSVQKHTPNDGFGDGWSKIQHNLQTRTNYWVALAFDKQSGGGNHYYAYGVFVSSGSFRLPAWAANWLPVVMLARVYVSNDARGYGGGVTQYHYGAISLFTTWTVFDGANSGSVFLKNKKGLTIASLTAQELRKVTDPDSGDQTIWSADEFRVDQHFYVGGTEFVETTITDGNGNSYQVLAKP